MTIVIDFIHVLEYLWKAAWCFHPPRDPAIEDWVTAQALDILHGRDRRGHRPDRAARRTTTRPGPAASTPRSSARPCPTCRPSSPTWTTPRPWPHGWPIATGVIEGACRHLVQDRMGITGARWGLQGAQAILWLRAIHASGDHDAYWDWHIPQEHHRNHLSRYQHGLELAA